MVSINPSVVSISPRKEEGGGGEEALDEEEEVSRKGSSILGSSVGGQSVVRRALLNIVGGDEWVGRMFFEMNILP